MPGLMMAAIAIVHVFLAQFTVGGGILLVLFPMVGHDRPESARPSLRRRLLQGAGSDQLCPRGADRSRNLVRLDSSQCRDDRRDGLQLPLAMGDGMDVLLSGDRRRLQLLSLLPTLGRSQQDVAVGDLRGRIVGKSVHHQRDSFLATDSRGVAWKQGAWSSGFFNPSFWPSLLFRTVVAMALAALVACVVVNAMPDLDRSARTTLINRASQLMIPMVLMPLLGVWYMAVMPADSRGWILGGSPAMMLFFSISVGASLAIGAYALIGLVLQKLYINGATASLLLLLAFGATGGGEFVREGSRKPFSIRHVLYSNAIRPRRGCSSAEGGLPGR